MKHYLYISKTKVNMLYPQIPKKWVNRFSEVQELKLGPFGVKRDTKAGDQLAVLVRHVKIVADYIRSTENVGTMSSPADYVSDVAKMHFAQYGLSESYSMTDARERIPEDIPFFFMCNTRKPGDDPRLYFVMVGSRTHLVGIEGEGLKCTHSSGATHLVIKELMNRFLGDSQLGAHSQGMKMSNRQLCGILNQACIFAEDLGQTAEVEFLAHVMHNEGPYYANQSYSKHSILASPIYVALKNVGSNAKKA
jgi:hypothetical protein